MKKTLLSLLIMIFVQQLNAQKTDNYQISVSISDLGDSTVYLAYHYGDKQYLKDTLKLDRSGFGVIRGGPALPQGIYMIVLPGRKYFEILIPDDQVFSVSCIYRDYFKTLKFSGSEENTRFLDYQKQWMALQNTDRDLNTRLQNNKQNSDSTRKLQELAKVHEGKMKAYLNGVAEANKGKLLGLVVRAIIPVEAPEIKIPAGTVNPDSVKWIRSYLYNKDHFFDNIDFNDERILRTPILYSKLNIFFSNVVIQLADSINNEIDRLMVKCSNDYKIFQFVAVYLFNHFRESEIMGHDAVIVKLADDYYLSGKADWTTKEWRDNLQKEVDRIRPNLIGAKARDLTMNTFNNVYVSLHDIDKDFVIIYFWEPDCGHCKEATPKLKSYYDKARGNGIEVFAVCTQADRGKWEKYIQEYKLEWINGWDPQRKTNYDYYYNVTATPGIYILDRNKKIIAKKLPVEAIESFIDNYRKYNKL
jgi:thiol-disulfide isomerase/thioredoxin